MNSSIWSIDWAQQVLPLRVDLVVMAMKGYSTFPKLLTIRCSLASYPGHKLVLRIYSWLCYMVICWFMQKYTYICWIHTDAIIIKTPDDKDTGTNDARRKEEAGRLLYNIFYLTSLFVSFERVVPSLHVRERWRPNITEIFWPQSYGRQRCVFLVLHGCSTGLWSKLFCVLAFPTTSRLPPSSTVLLALLLAYLQLSSIRRPYITFKLPRSNIDTPQRLCNLFRFPVTGMCHFLPVHHLEWYFWPGQKVKT